MINVGAISGQGAINVARRYFLFREEYAGYVLRIESFQPNYYIVILIK